MENATCFTLSQENATQSLAHVRESYANIETIFKFIGLPIASGFGIIANVLNLVILSRQAMIKSLSKTSSAHICILALSAADLGVCLFAFPYGIIASKKQRFYPEINFGLYYPKVADGAVNIFMMCSSWLIVILASERYVAVCHPLRFKVIVTFPRTVTAIVVTCVASVGLCLPKAWWLDVLQKTENNVTYYSLGKGQIRDNKTFSEVYILVFRIVQNYIPLILIVVLNIRLFIELRKTYIRRLTLENGQSGRGDKTHKLNFTLVGVIIIYLVLVAPSEVAKLIHTYGKLHQSLDDDYNYKVARDITNFMQIANYAVNFIWYCVALSVFRKTLRRGLVNCARGAGCFSRRKYSSVSTTSTSRQYQQRKHVRGATGSQSSATSQEAYV